MANHFARGDHPVAIILLSFNDINFHDRRVPSKDELFTMFQATTSQNFIEYYKDISRGNINVNGSQIFGWWTMKYSYHFDSYDPFHDPNNKTPRRAAFVSEARRLAAINGVDLTPFRGGLVVVTNGSTDGGSLIGEKNLVAPIGGEWWGQPRWEYCYKCGMLFFGRDSFKGLCPQGGQHAGRGELFSMAFNVPGFTGDPNFRRCVKCLGMFNIATQEDGTTRDICAGGGRHDPGTGNDASYPFTLTDDKVGGFIKRLWKRCNKCHVLVWTEGQPDFQNVGVCTVDWGGRVGKEHNLDLSKIFSIAQYYRDYHLTFLAHEFGHSLGMSESARKRSDKESAHLDPKIPKDDFYGDKWDIMSANNVWSFDQGSGPQFAYSGPGLSAPSLLKFGWMPKENILSITAAGSDSRVRRIFLEPLDAGVNATKIIRVITPYRTYTIEYLKKRGWYRAIPKDGVFIHELRSDYTLGEKGWRRCTKCAAAWCASSSACAGGESHYCAGGTEYKLWPPGPTGQDGWNICAKCHGIWFAGSAGSGGVCQAGGAHEISVSSSVKISFGDGGRPGVEGGWRWCHKCQMLFKLKGSSVEGSVCPAGDRHDVSGSGNYELSSAAGSQIRRCIKCQSLVSEGYGRCINGGRHNRDDHPRNALAVTKNSSVHPGQDGWKKCTKCYQLVFSLNGPGACVRDPGQGHTFGTDNYKVMFNTEPDPNGGRTEGWKWCRKCQVLVIAASNDNCAASGKHDHTGSGDYVLTSFYGDHTYLLGREQPTGNGTEYEWEVGQTWKSPDGKVP